MGSITFVAWVILAALNSQAQADRWAGSYECQGTSPDGQRYTLAVTIEQRGATYRLLARLLNQSQPEYVGIGFSDGERLVVAYWHMSGHAVSAAVYERPPEGGLIGRWTIMGGDERGVWGEDRVFTEMCLPSGAREATQQHG